MTKNEVAKMIDHTILKADASANAIKSLCNEAIEHSFASVCINPCYVSLAYSQLKNSGVAVCTVVGFPLGASTAKVKVYEAELAIDEGAVEIDMVINIGAVKTGNWQLVEDEVKAVVDACKGKNKAAIVKVIIETCLLNDDEKKEICRILLKTKADFVKTSTGFSTGGAKTTDIELIKSVVKDNMLIKASGGIKTLDDVNAMVSAGANRIGTSNGVAIINGCSA